METGNRDWSTTVVKNGKVLIALSTPLSSNAEFKEHMDKHGDGIKDIAFTVEDAVKVYNAAVLKGAKSVSEPTKIEDKNGYVIVASVKTYGDTIHTFIQRDQFKGDFLPNYALIKNEDPFNDIAGKFTLGFIDHVVGNHALGDMETTVQWYENVLSFHRFWSIDDSLINTEYRYKNINF